jgi:sterol desaturase/sphingolipid hydroxylase (fatty acid hydroxylase superfamily)
MSWQLVQSIYELVIGTFAHMLPYMAVAGLAFSVLSRRYACNRAPAWWRSRELATDLCYWFVVPLFTRFVRIGLLIAGAALLFGITEQEELSAFFDHGHGFWTQLPFWAQVVLFVLVADFLLYWSHRLFHGATMWKYHAIHHSAEEVNWTSAARFHPVNLTLGTVLVDVALLLTGVPPAVMTLLAPVTVFMSVFVHANLNWTLGPLRYVIVSPVFHRWHHTGVDEGGNMNFASNFAFFDLLFGTFYMPRNELPEAYGVDDPQFPQTFAAQLIHPFKEQRAVDALPSPQAPRLQSGGLG